MDGLEMYTVHPEVSYENALPLNDAQTSRFIKTVVVEAERAKEIDNIIRQRTAENSYTKALWSTQDVANELKEIKRQAFLEEMRARQIQANSLDLRELKNDIQRSYVCKALAQQVKEREENLKKCRRQKQLEIERVVREIEHTKELWLAEENEERMKKARFRKDLRNQMADKQKKKLIEYQEYLEEKRIQDARLEKLAEEDEIKKKKAKDSKKRMMESLRENIRENELFLKQNQKDNKQEEANIAEWIYQKELIKTQGEELKRALQVHKTRISNRIGMKALAIQNENFRKNELIIDLLIEERKALADEAEKKEQDRIIREREENRQAAIRYSEEIAPMKIQKQKEIDRIYYEEEMRLLAERDKLQQLSDEKRRAKLREHRRSILELMEDKKRRRAEENKRDLMEHEKNLKEEEDVKKLEREERNKLLKKHISEIEAYLPRRMLQRQDFRKIE